MARKETEPARAPSEATWAGRPRPWAEHRIGLVFVTWPVAPALVRYGVHVSTAGEPASGHRPVYVDIDPSKNPKEAT